jgi:LysM repeat protein
VPVWTVFAVVILVTIAVDTFLYIWLGARNGTNTVESLPLVFTPTNVPTGSIDLGASVPVATDEAVSTPTDLNLLEATATPFVTPSAANRTPTANKPAPSPVRYAVKAGDTLTAIAAKYHASIKAIVDANRLRNDTIFVGQELIIPVATSGP